MKREAQKLFKYLRTKPVPVNTREILALERTKLANERTLLAYIKASLYLLLGGLALLGLDDFQSIRTLRKDWNLDCLGPCKKCFCILRKYDPPLK